MHAVSDCLFAASSAAEPVTAAAAARLMAPFMVPTKRAALLNHLLFAAPQPAAVQLVLQTANIIQTYTSGAVPGAFAVTVPLAVERPLLFYPFDKYSADLVRCTAASVHQALNTFAHIFSKSSCLPSKCQGICA
jgi:hypothetical protein